VNGDFSKWLVALIILGFPLYLATQNKLVTFAEFMG